MHALLGLYMYVHRLLQTYSRVNTVLDSVGNGSVCVLHTLGLLHTDELSYKPLSILSSPCFRGKEGLDGHWYGIMSETYMYSY